MVDSVVVRAVGPGIEVFEYKGQVIGMFISRSGDWDKTQFLTTDDAYMQIGLLAYAAGQPVRAHAHHKVPREVPLTNEVLFCTRGRIVYTFYDENDNWRELHSCELVPGDVLCLLGAGHGGRAVEDSRLVEVKQGPFVGAADKHFRPA